MANRRRFLAATALAASSVSALLQACVTAGTTYESAARGAISKQEFIAFIKENNPSLVQALANGEISDVVFSEDVDRIVFLTLEGAKKAGVEHQPTLDAIAKNVRALSLDKNTEMAIPTAIKLSYIDAGTIKTAYIMGERIPEPLVIYPLAFGGGVIRGAGDFESGLIHTLSMAKDLYHGINIIGIEPITARTSQFFPDHFITDLSNFRGFHAELVLAIKGESKVTNAYYNRLITAYGVFYDKYQKIISEPVRDLHKGPPLARTPLPPMSAMSIQALVSQLAEFNITATQQPPTVVYQGTTYGHK